MLAIGGKEGVSGKVSTCFDRLIFSQDTRNVAFGIQWSNKFIREITVGARF